MNGQSKDMATQAGPVLTAVRVWLEAYRVEVALFAVSFLVLAMFSSQRFLRQSEAPHFVYQAQAWLEGRLDLDPQVLPNLEDWACVREVAAAKVRCEGRPLPTDRWYVSFPSFPAAVMLPFVALHGYQLNDTSFGVFVGALAVAFFYSLLRFLAREHESERDGVENGALALLLAFGTLFFYCAIRGEVWFSAEVMGVAFTCLYARNSVRARRPVLAGLFYSMAVLTRTPLFFSGMFFLVEALCPEQGQRLEHLRRLGNDWKAWRPVLRKLGLFTAGAAPLALLAAAYNQVRFGSVTEFGHRFLFNNFVNEKVDTLGLFHPRYLVETARGPGNLEAALLKLPTFSSNPLQLGFDLNGLTLALTFPLLAFIFFAPRRKWGSWPLLLAAPLGVLMLSPQWLRQVPLLAWVLLVSLPAMAYFGQPKEPRRLHWPLWLTVGATALPGFFYQNNGFAQFGYRFSLDYTPYLLLLFAVSAWSLKHRWVLVAAALGVVVNFWGAVAFRGYTEQMRHW
ncbi:MAG: hypothetical protein ACOZIN_12420 [Myxococcota bacterium]